MQEKVVGIIGGMGPEATVDLMARIIKATPALDDIDHIRMLVDNNPKIPSRIKALLEGTGESPAPCMSEMARKLEEWGVDFLAIPCNTAHYYYDDVRRAVSVPVLNMIDLTVETIDRENSGIKTVGLLATTTVVNLELFKKRFAVRNIDLINPSGRLQDDLMGAVRKIKTSSYGREVADVLQECAEELIFRQAEVLLIACTELSVIGNEINVSVPVYDSSQVLADSIVKEAKAIKTVDAE